MGPKEYKTPADLNGVVVRTPGADPYSRSIEALGATPYNIAWSEVYNSIQTKAIDACEVQYTSAVSSKIFEVCNRHLRRSVVQHPACRVSADPQGRLLLLRI